MVVAVRPDHIIIHCSATADSGTVSWTAIRRYHVEQLNWRDIGYHFGIERIGAYVEVMLGRWPDRMGAHCSAKQMNQRSLGICCVGDVRGHREMDARKRCPGLLWSMVRFRNQLEQEFFSL
jgi:hypothetical protein